MGRNARSIARISVLALFALASVALAAGPAFGQDSGDDSSASPDEVVATLVVSAEKVEVQKAGAEKFKVAKNGRELHEGDTIRTDATGRAEIKYDDESYTRLDVNTTFTIVSLTDDEGNRQVEGSLDVGKTWNRTSELTESESFEQSGAGATAAVIGTAFAIECDAVGHCVFTGMVNDFVLTGADGVIKLITPLDQCDSTTGVLCADITKISPDDLPAWLLENVLLDILAGYDDFVAVSGVVVVGDDGTVSFVPDPPASTPPPDAPGPGAPPTTPPPAPTGVGASAFNGEAGVSWSPGSSSVSATDVSAASPATSYTATSVPDGFTCTTSGTSCTVGGLLNGNTYVFIVTASNSAGTSAPSVASNVITAGVPIPYGSEWLVAPGTQTGTDWTQTGFDDSGWTSESAAFSNGALCGYPNNGNFDVNEILFLRHTFVLPVGATGLRVVGTIDNIVDIYINGSPVFSLSTGTCNPQPIDAAVQDGTLLVGENVIAVRAQDTGGATFFDLELYFTTVAAVGSEQVATEPDAPVVAPPDEEEPPPPPPDEPPPEEPAPEA